MEETAENKTLSTGEPLANPVPVETGIPGAEAAFGTASSEREYALEGYAFSKIEESKVLQNTSESLEDSTNQNHKLKPKRLTGAQRKKLIKAKLAERGEVYDPSYKKKIAEEKGQKRGWSEGSPSLPYGQDDGTKRAFWDWAKPFYQLTPGPPKEKPEHKSQPGVAKNKPGDLAIQGGSKETLKEAFTTTQIAIVPENYPATVLSEEQGETVQSALIGAIENLEDGDCAQLAGSSIERGAVILSCLNQKTVDWVLTTVPNLTPWEDAKLVAGDINILMQLTKVVLKTPKQLASFEPSQLAAMLAKQNATFDVTKWKVINSKREADGQILVFLVPNTSLEAIKTAGNKACLALWRVSMIIGGGSATGATSQPPTQ